MKTLVHIRRFIWSRALPKTGQITSYVNNDDGYNEYGWWRGLYNAGNKTRFILRTINGDNVVIDLATGLLWAADGNAAGCNNGSTITWANAITYAQGLSFAGFTDWHLPNRNELFSVIDHNQYNPSIKPGFLINTNANKYWTSSTMLNTTTSAWTMNFLNGTGDNSAKTNSEYLRACRII